MDERIKTAIDMMVSMVVVELSEDLHESEGSLFKKFIHSKTGKMLYDESSKLWWCGPSDIALLFKTELNSV